MKLWRYPGRAIALAALLVAGSASADVAVGDPAPDFRLLGSDGKYYQVSDFKGARAVVIAFFPKAFTGG